MWLSIGPLSTFDGDNWTEFVVDDGDAPLPSTESTLTTGPHRNTQPTRPTSTTGGSNAGVWLGVGVLLVAIMGAVIFLIGASGGNQMEKSRQDGEELGNGLVGGNTLEENCEVAKIFGNEKKYENLSGNTCD